MVVVRLLGGLGNQMFQYACGRAVADRAKTSLWLNAADIALSNPLAPRQYALNVFNITATLIDTMEVERLLNPRKGLIPRIRNWLAGGDSAPPVSVQRVTEKHFHLDPTILAAGDNIYLDGYWQSEKYFRDRLEIIRREFTPRPEIKARLNRDLFAQVERCESVSIHIRRGDYVSNPKINKFHGVCSSEYYQQCIEHVTAQVKKAVFFVFSDDPDWVLENLRLSHPGILVSNGRLKDYEELLLMSSCRHHIIANSSFSWWGAWLDPRPEKMVCAPEQWFADKLLNTSDLVPPGWVRF